MLALFRRLDCARCIYNQEEQGSHLDAEIVGYSQEGLNPCIPNSHARHSLVLSSSLRTCSDLYFLSIDFRSLCSTNQYDMTSILDYYLKLGLPNTDVKLSYVKSRHLGPLGHPCSVNKDVRTHQLPCIAALDLSN